MNFQAAQTNFAPDSHYAPADAASQVQSEKLSTENGEFTPEILETFGLQAIAEVARIKNVSAVEARSFIDLATFDDILNCFSEGQSDLRTADKGLLALAFCHISTSM